MVVVAKASPWLVAQTSGMVVPEPTRTIALMAILGIALLGLLMIVGVLLGGHWVRRLGRHRRGPAVPPDRTLRRQTPSERDRSKPGRAAADDFPTGETVGNSDTTVS